MVIRAMACVCLFNVALGAQVERQRGPLALRNWANPLLWETGEAPAEVTAVAASPLVFVGITPCRVADTRAGQGFSGAFGPPALTGRASRTFPMLANTTCPIPASAQAYSLNVTVVPASPVGFLTVYPAGKPLPLAATLNSPQGFIVGNAAVVSAGTNGAIEVYASDQTDLVIDINGYYVSLNGALTGGGSGGNAVLGIGALANNAGGTNNLAAGDSSLAANTTGSFNTAAGARTLLSNSVGYENTAAGYEALASNTSGALNAANGSFALDHNTDGVRNTATGAEALFFNTTGYENMANGYQALTSNTTGGSNTAAGVYALVHNTTGNNNVALGYLAANNVAGNGSNNIEIGNQGATSDNGAIRIGTAGAQTALFAAGIRGVTTGASDAVEVVIDSNGQLGTVVSSGRFKQDIEDMREASSSILNLRPVTFRYRNGYTDGSKPLEYGLIAEEVAQAFPELVSRSADGQIESVKYHVLPSLLLNELQKAVRQLNQQAATIQELKDRITALEQERH